jgi:hypothetical protein
MPQHYTDPLAVARMARGRCPECGWVREAHTGWGGPYGCSLTDNGVAQRIHQYLDDAKDD